MAVLVVFVMGDSLVGDGFGVEKVKKDNRKPFDVYQKAKNVYLDVIMWPIRSSERWWARHSKD